MSEAAARIRLEAHNGGVVAAEKQFPLALSCLEAFGNHKIDQIEQGEHKVAD